MIFFTVILINNKNLFLTLSWIPRSPVFKISLIIMPARWDKVTEADNNLIKRGLEAISLNSYKKIKRKKNKGWQTIEWTVE